MRQISKDELQKILADHHEWLQSDQEQGQRADLQRA